MCVYVCVSACLVCVQTMALRPACVLKVPISGLLFGGYPSPYPQLKGEPCLGLPLAQGQESVSNENT